MVVTSVTGHMMELDFTETHRKWHSCDPVALFKAPVRKLVPQSKQQVADNLKQAAVHADTLLLWLDCDTEGENIAFEVMQVCCEANPRLRCLRARFSALTDRDIFRACRHPDAPNERMRDAVDARMEVDLRLGAAFTRFQCLRYQKRYEELAHTTLSYGPCQFPTLGFIVDRYNKVEAFESDDFWGLALTHDVLDPHGGTPAREGGSEHARGAGGDAEHRLAVSFSWNRHRVFDRLGCLLLLERCIAGNIATVNCRDRVALLLSSCDSGVRSPRIDHDLQTQT